MENSIRLDVKGVFKSDVKRPLPKKNLMAKFVTVFIVAASILWLFSCSNKNLPKNSIESALLAQDWKTVFEECKKADSLFKKPETAALMGHAAIMLNKNNQSYILFDFLKSDSTRTKGWLNWTDGFQKQFPKRAIAHYFQGDANMRNGNKAKAIECFTAAIKIDPKCALAFNARGTIYALDKDKINASKDLYAACSIDSTVAEFFASRGNMYFTIKTPETSFKDFNKALKLNPTFSLALNGKACSRFFNPDKEVNEQELDTISYYFESASNQLNIPIINTNFRSMILEIENKMFPNEQKTPLFRGSDFLDWNILRIKSLNDKYDLFVALFKAPLPETLNSQFLITINTLLSNNNLYSNYLNNKAIPDSIKKIITIALNISLIPGNNELEKTKCKNRLVLEKYYSGLIATFVKREPGTTVSEKVSEYARNTQRDAVDAPKNILDHIGMDVKGTKISVGGFIRENVKNAAKIVEAGAEAITVGQTGSSLKRTQAENNANLENYKNNLKANDPKRYNEELRNGKLDRMSGKFDNPGGAIAEIRRIFVDNDTPYFLLTINSLGYE
jgi:tetratricopeptide (TPR) repeat protein